MNILRATTLTSGAALVRLAAGLCLNKLYAVYVGPAGFALLGQLGSLSMILAGLAGGGVANGVTRRVAEESERPAASDAVVTAAAAVCVTGAATCGLVLLAAPWIAQQAFGSTQWTWLVMLVAGVCVLNGFSTLFMAFMSGRMQVRAVAGIGMASSLAGLALTVPLTAWAGLNGALAGTALSASLPFALAFTWLMRRRQHYVAYLRGRFSTPQLGFLGKYSVMALVSAVSAPVAALLVREHIAATRSWEAAGHWQGVWRISEIYLAFATASLSVYLLPRLSQIASAQALRAELKQCLMLLVPVVSAVALIIYLLREWIVRLLFTEAFLAMTPLFAAQLAGDVIKIASWIFAYIMIARGMTLAYVSTEIVFAASFVMLASGLVDRYGVAGATLAHAINYAVYWAVVALIVRPHLRHGVA